MIGLSMGMDLRLQCVCPVCRQPRDEDAARGTAVTVEIFGTAAYAVCRCCGQEVEDRHDRNYRVRWRRYAKRHPERGGAA